MSNDRTLTVCLWFNGNAREALDFYRSVFPGLKETGRLDLGGTGDKPVYTLEFELFGVGFVMINEPNAAFPFNEAISLMVPCRNQQEIDTYWEKLTDGGKPIQCGWLRDRFGLAWQIVPEGFDDLLKSAEPARRQRILDAMMPMVKLDMEALWAA
ncbi:VOC family protein [Pseudomonas sp. R2.Fl]|nr:VOC family protein [Pseudomonas sp. R2.Fl]